MIPFCHDCERLHCNDCCEKITCEVCDNIFCRFDDCGDLKHCYGNQGGTINSYCCENVICRRCKPLVKNKTCMQCAGFDCGSCTWDKDLNGCAFDLVDTCSLCQRIWCSNCKVFHECFDCGGEAICEDCGAERTCNQCDEKFLLSINCRMQSLQTELL